MRLPCRVGSKTAENGQTVDDRKIRQVAGWNRHLSRIHPADLVETEKMKNSKVYQVDDAEGGAEGTAKELYAWIMAGIKSPPSFDAFRSRLRNGQRTVADLNRPSNKFSSDGMESRARGLQEYHHARKLNETKQKADSMTEPPNLDRMKPVIIVPVIPKLVGGKRYFRPGSLDSWPALKQAQENGGL